MTDAPEPTQDSRSRWLRCLGCLFALVLLGGCLWSITPPFLKYDLRNHLLDDPTYPATVLAVKHTCTVVTTRVLAPGESLRAGETLATGLRGTPKGAVTERLARRTLTSVREDGTAAGWPTVELEPGMEEARHVELVVTISAPGFRDEPFEWNADGRPGEWKPGTPCRVWVHTKGWTVQHVPATDSATPTSGR